MTIIFGKYRLEQRGDDWWLVTEGGEGMTVKLHEIDELLHEYYSDNF